MVVENNVDGEQEVAASESCEKREVEN